MAGDAAYRELVEAEATGLGSASTAALFRPAPIPVPDFSAGAGRWLRPASRFQQTGIAPARYLRRPRKLTPAQEAAIRALSATKSLRSLATEFGVSHETVRTVLRTRKPAAVALAVSSNAC